MGWPAKEYKRASISYLDGKDRIVNALNPAGGISTAEYNQYNDIIRTLNPDNRVTALNAKEHSKEISKELDTESTYNETGAEPGTELLSTLGPKHPIELPNGTHTEGREHTVYDYNENAPPESGPYHLVTKMTQGAQVSGKEETATVRTTKTAFGGQNRLGWKLRKPTAVTIEPAGLNLTHGMLYEPKTGNVTETTMPAAGAPEERNEYYFQFEFGKGGSGEGQFKEPQSIAMTPYGEIYVLDTGNNRVEEFNTKGELLRKFGYESTERGEFKEPRGIALDSEGHVWVADTGNNRVEEFSSTGEYETEISDLKAPQAVAVDAQGNVWVANTGEDLIEKYSYSKVFEKYEEQLRFGGKGTGSEQFNEPQGIAIGAEGNLYIADTGNGRIDEYSSAEKYIRTIGKEGTGRGEFKAPHGITTDSSGDVWVADTGNHRVQELTAAGAFLGAIEIEVIQAQGIAIDSEDDAWIANTGNNDVMEWIPNGTGYGRGATAHETQTIYYSTASNSKYPSCGGHPEWANLPCQTQPAAQPSDSLPKLQITTYTYNIWDEPETTTNTSATTTRTTTQTYDAAGRPKTTTITSSVGTALPAVTDEYNSETGAPEKQSTTSESKTKTITSINNTLGQLASYTDAAANTSTYEYDIDGRIHKTNDGKGTQTYTYNEAGLPSELVDSSAEGMKFTAGYDVEGNMLNETLPNGMTANYTYNATGKPTALEYKKTTHCSENCTWFSDTIIPSIQGQWLEQTSTFSHQAYTYDGAGRLTQVQNTPTGKGCTTRIYTYDADTNRTALTTREPGPKGECATEGGTIEKHTYDEADRLTDANVSYNTFGNITALPATDAGGTELTTNYYVDNQTQNQTQNGQTIGYNLDPAGRTLETISTGKESPT
jgi:YD repeat-containing protein